MGQQAVLCCAPKGAGLDESPRPKLDSTSSQPKSMDIGDAVVQHLDESMTAVSAPRRTEKVYERIGEKNAEESHFEDVRFSKHRKLREKSEETKALIKRAIKQDRICAMLEQAELDAMLVSMECYEFDSGEVLVQQGETGSRFLVAAIGTLEVSVNDKVCNTLKPGTAFGGIALLYNCTRTATVRAKERCQVWGATQTTFQTAVKESANRHIEDNRKVIETIRLFEGLDSRQKDNVCEAFFTEVFEAKARVVTQGEEASTMHVVKKGELMVYTGGVVNSNGELVGGQLVSKLSPGDCFGERALLQKEKRTATVVAATRSEVLCVSANDLREALGTDLAACLERNLILLCLKKSKVMSQFSQSQQARLFTLIQTSTFPPDAPIGDNLAFVIVLEGSVTGLSGGKPSVWNRGQSFKCALGLSRDEVEVEDPKTLRAEKAGARLALLFSPDLMKILQERGDKSAPITSDNIKSMMDAAADSAQKMALVRKVHIFRHLSEEQLMRVVSHFLKRTCVKGEKVVVEGEVGNAFYIIANGEVSVSIHGQIIRHMGLHAYFGERSLLLDEPRTATVIAASAEVTLWCIEKESFSQIVKGNMQRDLMDRIALQDTKVTMKDLKQIKVVGAGATGVVRMVEHKKTKARYALKRVKKEKNGMVPEDVKRECELLLEMDHPFILTLVKTFDTPKGVYILTELITGGELHGAIRQIPTVLSKKQAQFYTASLFIVLEELAARNIVYRDLKPENVMLDHQGYLKVIDFGISKKLVEGKNRTFTMVGTPHYMAPEVMRGQGYGTLVDLWSLGVIHFEFVCGYLPFGDDLEDPTEVCAAVLKAQLTMPSRYRDAAGKKLIEGLLQRQPKKRLGGKALGYEEVRSAEYFHIEGPISLFERILGRELEPPLVPQGEVYCTPEDAARKLSDSDLLG